MLQLICIPFCGFIVYLYLLHAAVCFKFTLIRLTHYIVFDFFCVPLAKISPHFLNGNLENYETGKMQNLTEILFLPHSNHISLRSDRTLLLFIYTS